MSIVSLIFKEIQHRKFNALLIMISVFLAVAFFIAYFTTAAAANRETTRITRDIGFNLRVIPRNTDMAHFWMRGFSDKTMPETTVKKLGSQKDIFLSYNHLVASLHQQYTVNEKVVLLTGLAPAITAPDQQKQPMGFQIKPGTLFLGYQAGQWFKAKAGDHLALGDQPFRVERVLSESGTDDDIRIYGLLSDVQRLLHLEGLINEIKAIDCLCLTSDQNPLKILREELEKIIPEAMVLQLRSIADARARQRQTTSQYIAFLTPLLLGFCATTVGLLVIFNVRERKVEIGILRALGHGSLMIAALFLGKALILGLFGALLGYGAGMGLALTVGPEIFHITAKAIKAEPYMLAWVVLVAPFFTALASFIPAMLAVTQDPAIALREE